MMLLRTFTAALLLSWGLSCAAQCPENVMVSCENLKVLARWDCKGQQPETNFKVKIVSTPYQYLEVLDEDITKETWYDLSHVVWKSKYNCLRILHVTVTASNGGNESAEVTSTSFSFNAQNNVQTICLLEFPPVSLVVNETRAMVKFTNPFLFYDEINQVYEEFDFKLIFLVNFGRDVDIEEFCSKAEPTCTSEVTFPDGEENCVTLEGIIVDENRFYEIQMNQTQKICASERTQCPENVMVSCENLKVLARWDCKGQQPETNFKAKIMTSFQVLYEDITKETWYDLSHVVWKSKYNCLRILYVTVTASNGGNESAEVASTSFSFNNQNNVQTICLLEFPPVSLVVNGTRAMVKFTNPFLFYDEINQVYKESDSELIFFGKDVDTEFCSKAEPTCTSEVTFPDGEENCVTLEGFLGDKNGFHKIQMNQTQKICASERMITASSRPIHSGVVLNLFDPNAL
ncbi:hypothetical protein OJAV_G00235940 [Oryzias javanicus]|uniref:Fibronectin type-III domain-containing protein n=1 Tax=Oryzias javanicus TaxID=123683 RepID=A0A3S2NNI2_ORYJA|nr:hypothetical protein OJAV_G00235940 [Oryzias javanicus]